MNVLNQTITHAMRICKITVTTTATTIRELVETRLTGLSKTMPSGDVLQVSLSPADDITVEDADWGDPITMIAGTTRLFACSTALDQLKLDIAAGTTTCDVILYLQN